MILTLAPCCMLITKDPGTWNICLFVWLDIKSNKVLWKPILWYDDFKCEIWKYLILFIYVYLYIYIFCTFLAPWRRRRYSLTENSEFLLYFLRFFLYCVSTIQLEIKTNLPLAFYYLVEITDYILLTICCNQSSVATGLGTNILTL